jgi:S-adenosylmethionine:tRNA ribosyltransferase-isomerase
MTAATLDFELPDDLAAREPAEAHGRRRDDVRLLVTRGAEVSHHRFRELPRLLTAGDLVVVNNSATLPAALDARADDGPPLVVHVSTERADGSWLIELRRPVEGSTAPFPDGGGPARPGLRLHVAGGTLTLREQFTARLWQASADVPGTMAGYLAGHGRPIRYAYTDRDWPLETYQNAYATVPGSAEMPSAGRPFTPELITALAARGVLVAPLVLHTGVSSLERGEAPYPERYAVPEETARLVNAVRWWGGRVIAVGTTAVRALETVAGEDGTVVAGAGWTRLVVTPERGLRAVDGLITGWHEPEASHLQMLEAVAGAELLEASYAEALRAGYLWHEFGDSHLILP